MKRQLQGIGLILFSILLTLGFASMGEQYVFDISLKWPVIFILIGVVGLVMVFWKDSKNKKE